MAKKKETLPEGFEPDEKIPEGFEPDSALPEGFEPDTVEDKPSLLKRAYKWATDPLTDAPSRFAKSVGEYVNPENSEGGYLRGLGQGLIQGVGDVASSFTSPVELAATVTGMGAVSAAKRGFKGANALRRATQALSAPELIHGSAAAVDPNSSLGDRALGLAEMAGGAAGMHFPAADLPSVRRPKTELLSPTGTPLTGDAANITDFLQLDPKSVTATKSPPKPVKASGALAHELTGAKPRFNFGKETYEPKFADDLDKALYIIAQESPSKRNKDYLKFAMDETGLDEAGVLQHAYETKKRIKAAVKGQPSGLVEIPSGGIKDSIRKPRSLDPELAPENVDLAAKPGGITLDDLVKLDNERTVENNAKLRGTPEDIPDNDMARQLEFERQALHPTNVEPNKPFVNPFAKTEVPEIPITPEAINLKAPIAKPTIKANTDGTFTNTATGQVLDKTGNPVEHPNVRMTGEVDSPEFDVPDANFDPFKRQNEAIPEFDTFSQFRNEGSKQFSGDEAISLANDDDPIPKNLQGIVEMQGGLFAIGGRGGGSKKLPPREGPVGAVVDKLMGSLQSSKGLRTKQDKMLSHERAQRFAAFDKVKETGQEGAANSLSKLKGEYSKVNRSPLQLEDADVDMLFTAVKDARITSFEKAQGFTSLFKILEGGSVPQRNELALLDKVFGHGFGDQIVEMHGGIGLVGLQLAKTANTMKAMMSSIDVSGPMRQGFGLIHKKEWRSAFTEMFKYLGDKKYYDAAMDEIQARPTYLLGREAGLFIADPKSLMKGEEAFMNNYVQGIPGIKHLVDASERAYVGFLNKLRADTFDSLIRNAQRSGNTAFEIIDDAVVPTKLTREISSFINNATGRGTLGSLEKMAPELNMVMWSPRLLSSRLNTLNPMTYLDPDIDNFTRKESIKSLLAMASAGSLMIGMGAAAGGSVSGNPTSSDFGKIRFGETVLDPWAGYQQPIVAAARFLSGFRKGEPVEGAKAIGRFMTNKLSPAASLAYEVGTAKELNKTGEMEDRYGNKTSVQRETLERFIPMFVQGLTEVLSENPDFTEGLKDIAAGEAKTENLKFAIPSALGVGVQNYPEPKLGVRRARKLTP